MEKFKKWFANPASHVNTIVGVIGLGLVLLILIPNLDDKLCNIFLSVGCSLMATSIATFIATLCITNQNEIKEMILGWKLKYIYKTKTEMNKKSNDCLDAAKKHIDIIAIGMSNFLSYKGDILEKKAKVGVEIRIISCDNEDMLKARERDEDISGDSDTSGVMIKEVNELKKWVERVKKEGGNITLKCHSTYPGFSYLRIDDNIFFGANLPRIKSQLNMAFEFDLKGDGGSQLSNSFDALWNDNTFCSIPK